MLPTPCPRYNRRGQFLRRLRKRSEALTAAKARRTLTRMALTREQLTYAVGSENDPGDPFGRSELVIEVDGSARLDVYQRGAVHLAWRGTVVADALDRLWAALD